MCGILAISSSVDKSFPLEESLKAIKHRGPDDTGIFVSKKGDCHLGHVRLSIIDLSTAGHQPMEDISTRYVISYNGEVYNYSFLKNELEKTHGKINWKSTTDTEVILEGFSREGISFLSKLNGIFSIAIYDKKELTLYILRDPIGIKPLYFTEQFGSFFFCSSLKGLHKFFNLKKTLRKQSMADQLTFMYVPEPYTMYQEFFKLEPGVCYVYKEGKQICSTKLFNHISDPILFSSEKEMIDCFRETFSSAVKRQLVSDVPVSLFLSGGIDSSAVAYEVIKSGANVKDAFTISFCSEDQKYDQQGDDLYYAKIIAKELNIDLKVFEAKKDFIDQLPVLIDFMEDGLSDPAAINTYLICKKARSEGVKVMLSGQGADEYLGGYRRYLAAKKLANMPAALKGSISLIGKCLPESMPGMFNAGFRRLKRFSSIADLSQKDRLLNLFSWNNPEQILSLFIESQDLNIGQNLSLLFDEYKDMDIISAMLLVDQKYDLMSLNLSYTDKMSMILGVEVRVPFLDFDLIRVMNSIPSDIKIKGNILKYPLRKAMESYLPKKIINRKKAGFALPLRSWFRKENKIMQNYFDFDRIKQQGIFNPHALQQMCDEQFSGKKDHTNTLFSMLCLQIWLDRN